MERKKQITRFEQRVYDAARKIPRGKVTTYARLARAIRCGSPRAVGQALARNPFAPEVPCHRVIASDLGLGGFQGNSRGRPVARKLEMLAEEGVLFADGRLVDADRVYRF